MRLCPAVHVLPLILSLVACGGASTDEEEAAETDPSDQQVSDSDPADSGTDDSEDDTDAVQTGCVGADSCEDLDETACQAAALTFDVCTDVRGDRCDFGYGPVGTPSDPGCSSQSSALACVQFSAGCGWVGGACSFKACHTLTTQSDCSAASCLWQGGACYYVDCSTLGASDCAAAAGCQSVQNAFVECTGSYTCADLDSSLAPPGTTEEEICTTASDLGLACSWVD